MIRSSPAIAPNDTPTIVDILILLGGEVEVAWVEPATAVIVVSEGKDATLLVPDELKDAAWVADDTVPRDSEAAPEVTCEDSDGEFPFDEIGAESVDGGRVPGVRVREICDMLIHCTVLIVVTMFRLYIRIVVDASESRTSVPPRSKVFEPGAKHWSTANFESDRHSLLPHK